MGQSPELQHDLIAIVHETGAGVKDTVGVQVYVVADLAVLNVVEIVDGAGGRVAVKGVVGWSLGR